MPPFELLKNSQLDAIPAFDGGTEVAENAALTTEAIVRGWEREKE